MDAEGEPVNVPLKAVDERSRLRRRAKPRKVLLLEAFFFIPIGELAPRSWKEEGRDR
jgi:hypothetical protein